MLLAAAAVLGGCSERPLVAGVSKRQSIDILAALFGAGVDADEAAAPGSRFTVTVAGRDFARAISVLKESGLPRDEPVTIEQLTAVGVLAPVAPELYALRLDAALEGQLERSVAALPGVAEVRATVRTNLGKLLGSDSAEQVSLIVRYPASAAAPGSDEIRVLASRVVPGVESKAIQVALYPVRARASSGEERLMRFPFSFRVPVRDWHVANRELRVIMSVLGVSAMAVGAIGGLYLGWRWRKRRRPSGLHRPRNAAGAAKR